MDKGTNETKGASFPDAPTDGSDEARTLDEMLTLYGRDVVTKWARRGLRTSLRRRKPARPSSLARINQWLRGLSDDELAKVLDRARLLASSGPAAGDST